jgi:hypothetical protein
VPVLHVGGTIKDETADRSPRGPRARIGFKRSCRPCPPIPRPGRRIPEASSPPRPAGILPRSLFPPGIPPRPIGLLPGLPKRTRSRGGARKAPRPSAAATRRRRYRTEPGGSPRSARATEVRTARMKSVHSPYGAARADWAPKAPRPQRSPRTETGKRAPRTGPPPFRPGAPG